MRNIKELEGQTVRVYTYSTMISGTLTPCPMTSKEQNWWTVANEHAKVTFSKAQVLYKAKDHQDRTPEIHIVDKRN